MVSRIRWGEAPSSGSRRAIRVRTTARYLTTATTPTQLLPPWRNTQYLPGRTVCRCHQLRRRRSMQPLRVNKLYGANGYVDRSNRRRSWILRQYGQLQLSRRRATVTLNHARQLQPVGVAYAAALAAPTVTAEPWSSWGVFGPRLAR